MELFSINASLFWFLFGVAFLVLEALTPGFFLMFFGLGAWMTSAILFFAPLSQNAQWAIFMVVSVAALVVLRKKLRALFQGRLAKTDNLDDPVVSDQYIGREVAVIKDIGPGQPGLVELNGTNWQARTEGPPLEVGQRARVRRLEGLTLIVSADD